MLKTSYVFGLKADVRGGVQYLEESDVVFVAGHTIVRMDADATSKSQRIVHASPTSNGVDALAVSPSKRFTAWAESYRTGQPTITVHDWSGRRRQRTILKDTDIGSAQVHAMCYTCDGKYLVVLSSQPGWRLNYISVEKGKILASTGNLSQQGRPLHGVAAHPDDPSIVLAAGDGNLRMYRLVDDVLRPLLLNLKQEPANFLSHCWLPEDRLVVGTARGEIWVLEGVEFKKALDTAPADGRPIDCIVPFSKGFVAGADGGRLLIFEKSDDARHFFRLKAEFSVPGDGQRVVSMSVQANEEEVAFVMSSGQGYVFRLANYELHKADDIVFAPLLTPLHGPGASGERAVVGLDLCERKPIFVTAGADRTVRVWSHLQYTGPESGLQADARPTVELVKRFSEEVHGIALHPSGFHIAVGFESGLQLLNVLMEDIKPVKDFPVRKCVAVKFSHGGQYLACANGAAVQVYDTYTAAPVATLRGHTDKVLALAWSPNDRFLVTAGRDQVVARWEVLERRLTNRTEVPDCALTSVSCSSIPDGSEVYVVGTNLRDPQRSPFLLLDFAAPTGAAAGGGSSSGQRSGSRGGSRGAGRVQSLQPPPGAGESALSISGTGASAPAADSAGSSGEGGDSMGVITSSITAPRSEAVVLGQVSCFPQGEAVVVGVSSTGRLGSVRVYPAPFPKGSSSHAYQDLPCHSAPVTRLAVSSDGHLVVSAAADGSIAIIRPAGGMLSDISGSGPRGVAAVTSSAAADELALQVKVPGSEMRSGGRLPSSVLSTAKQLRQLSQAFLDRERRLGWADEILVTKSALEGSRAQRERLKSSVAEVTLQNNYNLAHRDMQNKQKMQRYQEKYEDEVKVERRRLEALRAEKEAMEERFDKQTDELEKEQAAELEELEKSYKAKLAAEVERYDDLTRQRDERDARWAGETDELTGKHGRHLDELTDRFEAELRQEHERTAELVKENRELKSKVRGQMDTIEHKADRQLDRFRLGYEKQLAGEQKKTHQLVGANTLLKTSQSKLLQTKAKQAEAIKRLVEANRGLQDAVVTLRKDVAGYQKEIRERDETILEKDSRIDDLRKKNQELDKFKFVLNYKIQELQRQIAPRQREIRDMRSQLKDMELELLQYQKANAALSLMISEQRLKRQGLDTSLERAAVETEQRQKELADLQRELSEVGKRVDDKKGLRSAVTVFYRRHIHGDRDVAAVAGDDDPVALQEQHGRKRDFLERSVRAGRRKLAKDAAMHRGDRQKLMRENTVLTKEVNALRREHRLLTAKPSTGAAGLQPPTLPPLRESMGPGMTAGTADAMATGSPQVAGPPVVRRKNRLEKSGRARTMARFGITGGNAAESSRKRLAVAVRGGPAATSLGIGMGMDSGNAMEDSIGGQETKRPSTADRSAGPAPPSSHRSRKGSTSDTSGGGQPRHRRILPSTALLVPNPEALDRQARVSSARVQSLRLQVAALQEAAAADPQVRAVMDKLVGAVRAEELIHGDWGGGDTDIELGGFTVGGATKQWDVVRSTTCIPMQQ